MAINIIRFRILIAALLCMTALHGSAQDDIRDLERRWAVNFQGNFSWQTITRNETGDSPKTLGAGWRLTMEYYLPHSQFSITGGYDKEELGMFMSDITTELHQLALGGRYYMLKPQSFIQPYVGAEAFTHFGATRSSGLNERHQKLGPKELVWTQQYDIRNPRFSFAPVVGADIYFFSCIAFEIQYGFRMGTGSHFRVRTERPVGGNVFMTESKGMRHNLTMGVKVTFPFLFTQSDGNSLWEWIFPD